MSTSFQRGPLVPTDQVSTEPSAVPSARIRRSTVHRATGSPGWVRLITFHIFRAPYTPMFSSCSAARRSSMTASRAVLAEGGRTLRA